jgi:hypothetical protein
MVEPQVSNLSTGVRFPSSAPRQDPRCGGGFALSGVIANIVPPAGYTLQADDARRFRSAVPRITTAQSSIGSAERSHRRVVPRRATKVATEHEKTLIARARSFGSIPKLPSGKFQTRYWHLGKQIFAAPTYAAKTDARRWLSTVEADIVRGDWVDPDAGKITSGEYANWWIEQRPERPRTGD